MSRVVELNIFSISRRPKWFLNQQVPKKWFSNYWHITTTWITRRHCWIYYYYSLFPSHFSSITRHTANRQTDRLDVYSHKCQGRWINFFANNHRIWLRKIDFYIIFPLVYLCTFRKCQSPHCQLNVCVKIFIITTPRRDIFAIYMFSIKKQKRNGWSEWVRRNQYHKQNSSIWSTRNGC